MHTLMLHPFHVRHLGHKQHIIISMLLRDFAMSMVDFFVPIILLIGGYPLYVVGLFYVMNALGRILAHFLLPQVIGSIGVHNTMRLSFFMAIPYIIMLNYVEVSAQIFVATAIFSGIMTSFFWVSRHIDTVRVISKYKSAKQVSSLEVASAIMRIIAPFVGGIIAEYVSTQALLGVVFGILISAALVISQEARQETSRRIRKPVISSALHASNLRPQLANIGMNFQEQVSTFMWPVLIYISSDSLGTVGGILSFSAIAYIAMTRLTQKLGKKGAFAAFGILGRITIFGVTVASRSVGLIAASSFIGSGLHGMFVANYLNDYYTRAARDNNVEANILSYELFGDFGKLLAFSLFTLAAYNYSDRAAINIIFLLSVPAISLTSLMFIRPKH